MEKRSPKLPLHKEKIQSSCMRRLADALACKDGRSNQKLLSNGRPFGRSVSEVGHTRKADVFSSSTEKSKQIQKNHKKKSQSSKKMDQKPTSRSEDESLPENQLFLRSDELPIDKQNLAAVLDEIFHQIYEGTGSDDIQRNVSPPKDDPFDEASLQPLQLRAKAFIDHDKDMHNLVQRKLMYGNICPPKGNATSLASNKALNLKPKSRVKQNAEDVSCNCAYLQPHQSLKNKDHNTRANYLSFKDIKQTLKQAVGESKKKQNRSTLNMNLNKLARSKDSPEAVDEGTITNRESSALSPNTRRREKKLTPVDLKAKKERQTILITEKASKKIKSSLICHPKKGKLHTSIEAKEQLSERSKNVNLDQILPKNETAGALEMVPSLHDQEELASCSSNRHGCYVSTQMGCFHYSNLDPTNGSSLENGISNDPKNVEFKPGILDNPNVDTQVLEGMCLFTSDIKSCGRKSILEMIAVVPPGNTKALAKLYEPVRVDNAINEQITGKMKAHSKNHPFRLPSDLSSPLDRRKLQIADGIEDQEENTSPISVLEPFLPDEVSSPTSILPERVKSPLQPRRFHFDGFSPVPSSKDAQVSLNTCMDRKDFLYLYVQKVIQVSAVNFDELFIKGASPENIIKSCPNDGVAFLAVKLNCDLKLLVDFVREVMLGVYQSYFGHFRRLPFFKPNSFVTVEEKFIDEVVKQVYFYLLPKTQQLPIDPLVGKDLSVSSSWLDLHSNTEDILIQVAEDVLLDSIANTILEVQS